MKLGPETQLTVSGLGSAPEQAPRYGMKKSAITRQEAGAMRR